MANRNADYLIETLERRRRIREELAVEAELRGEFNRASLHTVAAHAITDDLALLRACLPGIIEEAARVEVAA